MQTTNSHHPLQKRHVFGDDDGLAAADADVSEDPQVDDARQDDGQAQQQETEQPLWTGAEQHAGSPVNEVLTGCVGWEQKKQSQK